MNDSFDLKNVLPNHLKTIDLKRDGCRMIKINRLINCAAITQPTSSNSFKKGFGICRILLNDFNHSEFIFVSETTIIDMALRPNDTTILTVSLAKEIKLIDLITKDCNLIMNLEYEPCCKY